MSKKLYIIFLTNVRMSPKASVVLLKRSPSLYSLAYYLLYNTECIILFSPIPIIKKSIGFKSSSSWDNSVSPISSPPPSSGSCTPPLISDNLVFVSPLVPLSFPKQQLEVGMHITQIPCPCKIHFVSLQWMNREVCTPIPLNHTTQWKTRLC